MVRPGLAHATGYAPVPGCKLRTVIQWIERLSCEEGPRTVENVWKSFGFNRGLHAGARQWAFLVVPGSTGHFGGQAPQPRELAQ